MSYEGEEEFLCANGHYHCIGCYEPRPETCGLNGCTEHMVWHHSIDDTNGYFENDPATYPAPLEEIGFEDIPQTDHHGNNYFTKLERFKPAEGSAWYKLPTPEEEAARQAEWDRKQAVFRQHADQYRIFHGETLLFHTPDLDEYEAKYDELWDTGEYPNLQGFNPWPEHLREQE